MLIYRCRVCNRIFGFPSPPALARCSSCEGGLVYLGQDQPPNEIQVNKAEERKGGLNWDVLLNLLKGLGAFWGTGGAINIVGKSVNKEKIGKGDLSHTLLPLAGAGLIHGFQHPQRVKNFFLPAQSRIETDEKVRKVIQIIRGQGLNKGSQNPPSVVPQDKVNYRFEGREDPTNQRGKGVSKNTETVRVPRGFQWLRILSTRPRILILGGQGTGKSCLAFWLLEILHPRCPCFLYRLPAEGASFIPPWLGIVNELNRAPPGSIVLVDEAYLSFFSRESQTRQNREITRIVNLARQKNLGLIFVAHEARHIDKNILSCIDTLVIKRPAPLQVVLDRSFLRPYLLKAESVFQGKTDASSRNTSYICFSPAGFEGVLENPKPSFWSDKLSHIFASGNLGEEERSAKQLSKEEKRKRAKKTL